MGVGVLTGEGLGEKVWLGMKNKVRDMKRAEDKGLEVLKTSRREGGEKGRDEWLWL